MKTLAERLAHAMKVTGFNSQTSLAKASGVEQSSISKILRGASKTSKDSGRLASAMGISADWLINGSGEIYGNADVAPMRIDVSKLVKVYDQNGETGEVLPWFNEVKSTVRAYKINKFTGISQTPVGSVVTVDPEREPSAGDIVLTIINGNVSTFRFHLGGDGKGFLSVDDDRVPLAEVKESTLVVGPIMQVFIPELNK